MTKLNLLLMGVLSLALSCSKEKSEIRLSQFEIPTVTGIEFRDNNGNTMYSQGSPNIKLGNESNDYSSQYYFRPYPNPCSNICSIFIKTPNAGETKYVWIVRAQHHESLSNMQTDLGSNTANLGGAPLIQAEFTTNNTVLDVGSLTEGYYRIYLKVDDILLYDNLLIKNN